MIRRSPSTASAAAAGSAPTRARARVYASIASTLRGTRLTMKKMASSRARTENRGAFRTVLRSPSGKKPGSRRRQ